MKIQLYLATVSQGHHNLIPFSCNITEGINHGDIINFELNGRHAFEKILKNNVNEINSIEITDNNIIDLEILCKSNSGIKNYNIRSQQEEYYCKNIEFSYNVPKFSWIKNQYQSSNGIYILIGNEKDLNYIYFDYKNNTIINTINLMDEINSIEFMDNGHYIYVSTQSKIYKLLIYQFGTDKIQDNTIQIINETNSNQEIIGLIHDNKIWSFKRYTSILACRNAESLELINEFSGFDSPNKIIWSDFHKDYFISGSHMLWKLNNGNKKIVFFIEKYNIEDFDISKNGEICIIFNGDVNNIIKIIGNDLWESYLHYISDDGNVLRFCKYIDDLFYILSEKSKNNNTKNYNFYNYIFNIKEKTLKIIEDQSEILITNTTTTPSYINKKIKIIYPTKDEYFIIGSKIEIEWMSTQSATDLVKIDLLKDNEIILNIEDNILNSGKYEWEIPKLENNENYQIRITWIGTNVFPENVDESETFTISNIPKEIPIDIRKEYYSIEIDKSANKIVNILNNGLLGWFDLEKLYFDGLFKIENINSIQVAKIKEDFYNNFENISHVRIFVGTKENLSDKWDSGIIETKDKFMYYGGGNNLIPGEEYFVNIQLKDAIHGWSKIQTKKFKMPN
jgi:hypothetical protein